MKTPKLGKAKRHKRLGCSGIGGAGGNNVKAHWLERSKRKRGAGRK